MRFSATALILLLLGACAPTMVPNTPRNLLLGKTYDPAGVRDAVARAVNKRKMSAQGETEGQALALDTHHGARCFFTIQYTATNLNVSAMQESADPNQGPSTEIDSRCLEQAELLLKIIAKEAERPAKIAAKEERARRRHELAVERAREGAAQAELASQQLAAQQAAGGGDAAPADDGSGAMTQDAPAQEAAPVPEGAPAPGPTIIRNNTVVNRVIVNRTVVSAPPQQHAPQISPLLCCKRGQPFVCPNVRVYQAACLQKPAAVGNFCRIDPAQARYCH